MLPTAAPVTTNRCVREGHPEQRADAPWHSGPERRAHKTKMTALCSGRVLGLAPHQRERDHGELGCVSSFLTFFLIAVSGSHFVTTSAADVFEGHVADPLMQRTPGMAPLILSLPCSRSRAGEPFLAQRGARSDLAADGLARAACGGKCRVIDAADRRRSSSLRSSDEIA
jgi:hypothetical protein